MDFQKESIINDVDYMKFFIFFAPTKNLYAYTGKQRGLVLVFRLAIVLDIEGGHTYAVPVFKRTLTSISLFRHGSHAFRN